MVKVSQTRSGVIEVDFSGEPSFDCATHGLDITFGLTTRAIKTTSILVDDGGDPGSVLHYLVDAKIGNLVTQMLVLSVFGRK